MKQGAGLKFETAELRPVNFGAGQIGRQQVRGKLHPVKIGLNALAENVDGAGFGQTRRTFHQQVAVGQQRDQHPFHQDFLADDLAVDVVFELLQRGLAGIWAGSGHV